MSQTCTKHETCPIFLKNVFQREGAKETYRSLYCNAGPAKYQACKRYIISEETGKAAPEKIMPNSSLTLDQIKDKMKEEGIL
jgi:hypothetical protein